VQQVSGPRKIPLGLLIAAASLQQVIMGGTFVFARYVLQLLDPFAVACLRFSISSIILCSIACSISHSKRTKPIEGRDRIRIFLLGVVIILLNQVTYLYGQKLTTAAHGGLLFTITPVFVYMLAIRFLNEKWSSKKGAGIALTVLGAAIIFFEQGIQFNPEIFRGDLIILLAVVAWAVYTVQGKPLVEKYGAFRVTAYALASGSLVYLPFGFYRLLIADWSQMDNLGWVSIGYISIATSIVGYSAWYWLLKHMEASRLAVLTNLQPIVAGFLGYYFLREVITLPFLLAGLIIIIGVTVTQKA
jgi:drug/metabolite transporter (DMT)-like permease